MRGGLASAGRAMKDPSDTGRLKSGSVFNLESRGWRMVSGEWSQCAES